MPTFARFAAGRKFTSLALASLLFVTGCAPGMIAAGPMTPAQQQLVESNKRFNQTTAEGAIGGLLLGAAAGALLGGRNPAQSIMIGAAAGAVVGGAAGYLVARNNLKQAHTEDDLKKAIAEAKADADSYSRSAEASRQIANDARARAAVLADQVRSKTITAAQYKQNLIAYQNSADILRKQVAAMGPEIEQLRADAATYPQARADMLASANAIAAAQQTEKASLDALDRVLAAEPVG